MSRQNRKRKEKEKNDRHAKKVTDFLPKKGLKVTKTPDILKQASARHYMEQFRLRQSTVNLLSIVPDNLTMEQRMVREASALVTRLMGDEDIAGAVHALTSARQIYAVVLQRLQEIIEKEKEAVTKAGGNWNPLIEDFLVQFAMYEASKQFTSSQCMDHLINVTMPYLADLVDEHLKEEAAIVQEERTEWEKNRRTRPIPLGFAHSVHEGSEISTLPRERSLILAGWRNALLYIIDQMLTYQEQPEDKMGLFMTIRFMVQAPKEKSTHAYLLRLAGNLWQGCADSQKKMAICMGTYVADKLSSQPDLLIFDDLAHAFTSGLVGRPDAAVAGDAQKQLRRWCNTAGAALIGLVPSDDKEAPDVMLPQWEQLRTFTYLRPVTVLDSAEELEEGKYRIIVGNHAAVFDVDKTLLDNYAHGNIIVPASVDLTT